MEDELVAHGQNEPFSCSKWIFFGHRALPIWRGICHGQSMQKVPQNCWNLWGEALVAKNGHRPRWSQCIQMSSWVYVVAYTLNDRPYGIYIYVSVCLQPLGRHNYWDLNILCPFGFDSICATLVDCKRDSFRWLFELILCELVVWNVGNTKRHCNPPPVISNDELRHFSHLRSLVQA